VKRTLRFLEMQRRYQHPTGLWLMGGGASVRNIGPYLTEAIGMPVHIWDPPADPEIDEVAQGRHSALFGAAFALSTLAWRAA
jgi:Tfp pilus assembly PilM family ATPase